MNRRIQDHVHVSLLVLTLLALGACSPQKAGSANKRIFATVNGLLGSGLVIQTNGGNSVTVTAKGSVLLAYISSGAHYDVTIKEQPHDPVQSCAVTGGSGTVGDSDVSDISVACTGGTYDVIARVSGLVGQGLVLKEDFNGSAPVTVTANGTATITVTLASQIVDGSPYAVEATDFPTNPSQACTVSSATGKLEGANAIVTVTCAAHTYDINASVSGLQGVGLVLKTDLNGSSSVPVTANGTVTFVTLASQVADGSPYSVEVVAQPTSLSQTCTLSSPSGVLSGANVTVAVTCTTNSFPVGGVIIGYTGSGLVLEETRKLGTLQIASKARAFAFSDSLLSGSPYSVQVSTQPTSGGLFCSVLSASATVTDSNVHVAVLCRPAVSVVAGWKSTFAIRSNGTLWAWGYNGCGQLGNGNTSNQHSPVGIGNATNWTLVSAGMYHATAIRTDGTLWAWGDNRYGQLGDGTQTSRSAPQQIGLDNDWTLVSSSYSHNVALKANGTLWAWGDNSNGQLGDGSRTSQMAPKQIGNSQDWAFVSAGEYWTVALKADGSLWGWGSGTGALPTANPTTPQQVGTATDWNVLSANGFNHTVALRTTGFLWAWGYNPYGELGDNTKTDRADPEQIGSSTDWALVSAGGSHSAAVKTNGTLWAWGYNYYGELGDSSTIDQISPEQIGSVNTWALVSAGTSHTVALKTDGSLWSWGDNTDGQLGDGTTMNRTSPYQVW